jgi:hypothetical protein
VDWVEGVASTVGCVLFPKLTCVLFDTLNLVVSYPAWSVVWVGCRVVFVWIPATSELGNGVVMLGSVTSLCSERMGWEPIFRRRGSVRGRKWREI